jgi:hypothetical protein
MPFLASHDLETDGHPVSSPELLAHWRTAQRVLRHLAIGSPEHTAAVDRIAQYRAAYLEAIRDARRDHRPEPAAWPMMSPRSQAGLPIEALDINGERIPLESGWLMILEQQSGRRDWHANALFAEIHLERRQAEEVDVVIGTPSGTLRGRAIVTGRDPFGISLAAAPGGDDVWSGGETA